MESKVNWQAVSNYISDALDYFYNNDFDLTAFDYLFKDSLEFLFDKAYVYSRKTPGE